MGTNFCLLFQISTHENEVIVHVVRHVDRLLNKRLGVQRSSTIFCRAFHRQFQLLNETRGLCGVWGSGRTSFCRRTWISYGCHFSFKNSTYPCTATEIETAAGYLLSYSEFFWTHLNFALQIIAARYRERFQHLPFLTYRPPTACDELYHGVKLSIFNLRSRRCSIPSRFISNVNCWLFMKHVISNNTFFGGQLHGPHFYAYQNQDS